MLQIALPNKGVLSEDAVQLVRDAGYHCKRERRSLSIRDTDNGIEFLFLRPRDIAIYVSRGILDLGITGRDLSIVSRAEVEEVMPLGFGKATFCYAVPNGSGLSPSDFDGIRIATSYSHLVESDMQRRGASAEVVPLDGAVEISIQLGVADAIADVVQTGRTLERAGLSVTGDPVLQSEAILVAREKEVLDRAEVRLFIDRLQGIIVARDYVMIEYDIPSSQLEAACAVTPGIESPTVAPLSKMNWSAVKSMARRRTVNGILDELSDLGAKGIIVTDIRTCRI